MQGIKVFDLWFKPVGYKCMWLNGLRSETTKAPCVQMSMLGF